jgi:hypothetical protein
MIVRRIGRLAIGALLLTSLGCGGADDDWEPIGQVSEAVKAPLASAYCNIVVEGKGSKPTETDYLPRVITCENGGANLQALKAQAIAARSVAYYAMATKGSICDSQGCQVYTCGAQPQAKHYQAVKETAGMYLSYASMLTYGFYVAGASNVAPPSCKDGPSTTTKWITYNEGKTGTNVQQTPLGYIGPPGFGQNRGCMGQWGARCLENSKGYTWKQILQFYYGADIGVLTAPGPCVSTVCTSGQTQKEACGNCGARSRTCTSSGQWGSWSTCSGQGVCAAGTKQSGSCGNCGTRTRTCSSSCAWGSWSACSGEGVCAPGSKQSGSCGNCGSRSRTCATSCAWGAWSTCSGQGVCAAGTKQSQSCGDCGTRERTCSSSCSWNAFGACGGPDPEGGNAACDTGLLGACAAGRLRCEEGTLACRQIVQPAAETCSGTDDDCNGLVDDGTPAELGATVPEWAAELVSVSYAKSMEPGASGNVSVEFRNVGSRPWKIGEPWLVSLDLRAGKPSPFHAPGSAWNDVVATPIQETQAGQIGSFQFAVRAPDKAGEVSGTFQLATPDGELLPCPTPAAELKVMVGTGGSSADAGSGGVRATSALEPLEGGCSCRIGARPTVPSQSALLLLALHLIVAVRRRARGAC